MILGLIHSGMTTSPRTSGSFYLLMLPLFLICWLSSWSSSCLHIQTQNCMQKDWEHVCFCLGLFSSTKKTFPKSSLANLLSCLLGRNCIRYVLPAYPLARGMEIVTAGSDCSFLAQVSFTVLSSGRILFPLAF